MKTIRLRRVLAISGLSALLVLYVLLWLQLLSSPEKRTGADFIGHFSAIEIARANGFSHIYDLTAQRAVQTQLVGFDFPEAQTGYFTHPPFILLLVWPFATQDFVQSLVFWQVCLLLIQAVTAFLLSEMFPVGLWTQSQRWTLGLGVFLFFPGLSGFLNGQDTALLTLGTAIWAAALRREKYWMAGLGLSLWVIRPQIAILLLAALLFSQRKMLAGFLSGALALTLISLMLIGVSGVQDYLFLLGWVKNGLFTHAHTNDMPTLAGILVRSGLRLSETWFQAIIWAGFFIALVGVAGWRWLKRRSLFSLGSMSGLILLALIFLPYAHYHETVLLIVPCLVVIQRVAQKFPQQTNWLMLTPLAVSFFLLPGFFGAGALKYPLIYVAMFLLALALLQFKDKETTYDPA